MCVVRENHSYQIQFCSTSELLDLFADVSGLLNQVKTFEKLEKKIWNTIWAQCTMDYSV